MSKPGRMYDLASTMTIADYNLIHIQLARLVLTKELLFRENLDETVLWDRYNKEEEANRIKTRLYLEGREDNDNK